MTSAIDNGDNSADTENFAGRPRGPVDAVCTCVVKFFDFRECVTVGVMKTIGPRKFALLALTFAVALFASTVAAQTNDSTAPTTDSVVQLLDAMGGELTLNMMRAYTLAYAKKNGKPIGKWDSAHQETYDRASEKIYFAGAPDALVAVLKKHYTQADVDNELACLAGDAGHKVVNLLAEESAHSKQSPRESIDSPQTDRAIDDARQVAVGVTAEAHQFDLFRTPKELDAWNAEIQGVTDMEQFLARMYGVPTTLFDAQAALIQAKLNSREINDALMCFGGPRRAVKFPRVLADMASLFEPYVAKRACFNCKP